MRGTCLGIEAFAGLTAAAGGSLLALAMLALALTERPLLEVVQ
jgi:hypothetical protein